jgi:hypothetical protein
MSDQVMEGLLAAKSKWESILYEGGEDNGYRQCKLCSIFREPSTLFGCSSVPICKGCPIGRNCQATPYMNWIAHHAQCHIKPGHKPLKILCAECKEIAMEELNFIKNITNHYIRKGYLETEKPQPWR